FGAIKARGRHSDYVEEVAVYLITRADNRRIGTIFVAPHVVAHDRDRRRSRSIVRIGCETANPGIDAERSEEIAGDEFPVARIDGALGPCSADAQRRISGLQCSQIGELWRMLAEILVRFVGEYREISIAILCVAAPVAAADFVANAPQLFGLGDWERLQRHLMDESENRSGRSDTQCECDD